MSTSEYIDWRITEQDLAPVLHSATPPGQYDLYPGFPVNNTQLRVGFPALAEAILPFSRLVIDGYVGVFWKAFREHLNRELSDRGRTANWIDVSQASLPQEEILKQIGPFLGGEDPIFGKRYPGHLADFFDPEALHSLAPVEEGDVSILYGTGASLAEWEAPLMYIDVPKNEIQYRSRAGSIRNLGMEAPADPKSMYKQFYFVDWVVLNRQKAQIVHKIDFIVDGQRPDMPVMMTGDHFRMTLSRMSRNYFRVRPWFEPGAWGGQWCKRHIPQLPKNVQNYAWSFELIAPENGIMFSVNGKRLEVSFDWLMYQNHRNVLGEAADLFGYEFPIRFDFLDTVEGGNLSVQCHPRLEYCRDHFGESITQTETYYILDHKPGAKVYLGFQEGVDPKEFRAVLEQSARENIPVEVDQYVQSFPTKKHHLYLHPSGTIHSSGAGNLVLEISSTPYIFTFKMYDWLRMDLDGNPRPLNIERAFENLQFNWQGARIEEEFISQPRVINEGDGWQLVHLPTHKEHFYDVHRYEFKNSIEAATKGHCHVMNLVEGTSVILETESGMKQRFNYAETFEVPAAAGRYRLINEGRGMAKVVKAFVKTDWTW